MVKTDKGSLFCCLDHEKDFVCLTEAEWNEHLTEHHVDVEPRNYSIPPWYNRHRVIEGAGKDAPVSTNELGGKQSHIAYRFDLFDGIAMAYMAGVLYEGAAKYGEENWRMIDVPDHLNHALLHIFAYLSGDKQDDHLSHLMCRAMFAQAVEAQGGPIVPD